MLQVPIALLEPSQNGKFIGALCSAFMHSYCCWLPLYDSETLTKLDISSNYACEFGSAKSNGSQDFIRPIASMLKTNFSITELNLSSNNLNTKAAGILATALHNW